MLNKLKQWFDQNQQPDADYGDHRAELAATALLIELSHADHEVDEAEVQTIIDIARSTFSLSAEEIDTFFSKAETRRHDATSLYEFTDIINNHFDKNSKFALICDLWRVAYADGEVDRYEDHTIRKIAELIYVSHSEFIRAKHLVGDV